MGQSQSGSIKKDKIDNIENNTHFEQKDLMALSKQFKKETPTGTVTKADLVEIMEQMGVNESLLQDLIFNILDHTRDGVIDFQDFIIALSVMTRGTTEEKLEFAFRMYDTENKGYITKENLKRVMDTFYRLVGPLENSPLTTFSGQKFENPQQLVDSFFEQMDTDRDGKISLKDYKENAMKNHDIMMGLKLVSTQ